MVDKPLAVGRAIGKHLAFGTGQAGRVGTVGIDSPDAATATEDVENDVAAVATARGKSIFVFVGCKDLLPTAMQVSEREIVLGILDHDFVVAEPGRVDDRLARSHLSGLVAATPGSKP